MLQLFLTYFDTQPSLPKTVNMLFEDSRTNEIFCENMLQL